MPSGDLFGKEEAVIAAAQSRLESPFGTEQDRDAYAELFDAYQRLLRTTRRLMRLSDRNEHELSALAEKQRQASEQIARKNRELETLSNKLAKYLSPQVYQSIFSGQSEVMLASRRRKLTVFFSDIAGFTEASEKMEPEDLTQLLNHYLAEMSQVALAHGATIDKYVGDAIMIFFGDPETRGVKQDEPLVRQSSTAYEPGHRSRLPIQGAVGQDPSAADIRAQEHESGPVRGFE